MKNTSALVPVALGALLLCARPVIAQTLDAVTDPRIDPQVRAFLAEIDQNSSPFWELPQPKPQDILTALQNKTPVDMSGQTTVEKTITQNGRTVKLYIMTPQNVSEKPGVLLFIHGGVWIVGNFENHKRLLRDLVVGSGQVGVFVEYTSLPQAKYPTQMEESYAALEWVAAHASEFGADGSRIAVAGNSVGGDMSAALTLMAKDRKGPKISYQVLLIPATERGCRYRHLSRVCCRTVSDEGFHEIRLGPLCPGRRRPATSPMCPRCELGTTNSRGCHQRSSSRQRMIRSATKARRMRATSRRPVLR